MCGRLSYSRFALQTKPLITSFFFHLLLAILVLTIPIDALLISSGNPILSVSCALESAVPILQLVVPLTNPTYGSVSALVAASWLLGDIAKLSIYLTQPTAFVFICGVIGSIGADSLVLLRIYQLGLGSVKYQQLERQKQNFSPMNLKGRQDAHIL